MIKLINLLKEAENFDLSDNPLNPYDFKIGDIARESSGDRELCKILDRRRNLNKVKQDPVDKQYFSGWIPYDTSIHGGPWYLVQWLEHNADKNPTWQSQSELIPVEPTNDLEEADDFDLSDNPFVGDLADELAYAKFGNMNWVDLKNDDHGELNFGSKYNKHVFNNWDEWVEWLTNDATDLQRQNLRAFDITPFLPNPRKEQFTTAKAFFNMYQKRNNGAPFILMYRK